MTPLVGHDRAIATFRAALDEGRLHHAWLLAGPPGVGKGMFARKAALRALADAAGPIPLDDGLETDEDHPTARLFEAGPHPDLRIVKREAWAGTPPNDYVVPEHERSGSEALARGIRIKQIRGLGSFLSVRPTLSRRRVIIVDPVDDFEAGAAQALLKSLEEPPADTIFLLVSHSPERLLPTIRSRCRLLRFAPLDDAAMTSAIGAALPDADKDEIRALVAAGNGAPGRAISWRGLDIGALDAEMDALATAGDPTNGRRSALAQRLSLKSAQDSYEAFLARVPSRIAAAARSRGGPRRAEALKLWESAASLAAGARRQSLDAHGVVFELGGMLAALAGREDGEAA